MGYNVYPAPSSAKQWKQQIFTSSGTWVKPTGVNTVEVFLCGAGGQGASGAPGGGGGVVETTVDVSSVSSVNIAVGKQRASQTVIGTTSYTPVLSGTTAFGNFAFAHNGGSGTSSTSGPSGGSYVKGYVGFPNPTAMGHNDTAFAAFNFSYGSQPTIVNGTLVAGTSDGNSFLAYKKDSSSFGMWTTFPFAVTTSSKSVASDGRRLIATGDSMSNTYWTDDLSTTTIAWNTVPVGITLSAPQVLWTGTEYLLLTKTNSGAGLSVYYSADGTSWTLRSANTSGFTSYQLPYARIHSNGIMTLTFGGSGSTSVIKYSSDYGATWNNWSCTLSSTYDVVYYNGTWMIHNAGTSTYHTANSIGGAWTARTGPNNATITLIALSNSGFMIVASTTVYASKDGIAWDAMGSLNGGAVPSGRTGTSLGGFMYITGGGNGVSGGTPVFPDGAHGVNWSQNAVAAGSGASNNGLGIDGFGSGMIVGRSSAIGAGMLDSVAKSNDGICIVRWME